MRQTVRQFLKRTVCVAILLTVSGCGSVSGSPDFCIAYTPVPTIEQGTEEQKIAVDENNAVYMRFCE